MTESGSRFDFSHFDSQVLKQLACPVCYADLRLREPEAGIVCLGCGRVYPLVDGIPVLIAERAAASE